MRAAMRPPVFIALTVCLTGSLLAGCGSTNSTKAGSAAGTSPAASSSTVSTVKENPTNSEKTVKHVWGETAIKGVPAKIASLDFAFIDMLVALDVKPVAGVAIGESKFPDYVQSKMDGKDITSVGEAKQPNLEVLKSVKPDLIIANPDRHGMIKDQLGKIAPTLALDDNSYKEVFTNFNNLADILGKKELAQKLQASVEAKFKIGKEKIKNNPTVLVVGAFEDDSTVWLKSSFIGSILTELGTNYLFDGAKDNSAAESKTDIAKLSLERLSELNPDYLFVYGEPKKWSDNPLYKNLKSVKENKAFEVNRDLWSKGRGPLAADQILDEALEKLTGGK